MNPQPSKLYFLIKLHKDNEPVRPVVSFLTEPSVRLSKRLIPLIMYNTNFKPTFTIKKSAHQLIDNVKDAYMLICH